MSSRRTAVGMGEGECKGKALCFAIWLIKMGRRLMRLCT